MDIIKVFIDGSCLNNQKKLGVPVVGGCGGFIIYPNGKKQKFKTSVEETKTTNNVAELYGLYNALKIIKENYPKKFIYVYSDSKYVINIYTKNYKKWVSSEWKLSNGKIPENSELIQEIKEFIDNNRFKIIFKHCEAHKEEPKDKNSEEYFLWYGNNVAHEMAISAATQLKDIKVAESLAKKTTKKISKKKEITT